MTSTGVGPRVGVASIIVSPDNHILIGKRKSSHGAGKYQLPGGHLEYGEDPLACAEREAEEETGLKIRARKIVNITNDVFEAEKKHYITLFVWCEMVDPSAEPQTMEPDKCESWSWSTFEELRNLKGDSELGDVLFLPLDHLLSQTRDLEALRP
ncbi:NUDIX domain-containing protein [Sarocladium implicatum]|nr:NUDIX domain-containing protein [Sarocladium implicatum]